MTQATSSFFDRWYWVIVLAFLAVVPFAAIGFRRASETADNHIEQWLPSNFDESKTHDWFLGHFGSDEFVLVTWKDCTLDDKRLPQYAKAVRRHLKPTEDGATKKEVTGEGATVEAGNLQLFSSVTTGVEMLEQLLDPKLKLNRKQALERLYGLTIGKDSEITGTVIVLSDRGDDDRLGTIGLLREIARDEIGIAEENIHMVGDAVTNAAVDDASKKAIQGLMGLCGLVALVMAIVSLRSVRLLIVIFSVSAYCFLIAQAAVYYIDFSSFSQYFGGKMNLVLVVMPVLVYVLAMSSGVHLVNYYRDAAAESSIIGAPQKALRIGWVPCTLAAGTTAVGVGSLAVSNIRPVRDFGTYSAVGIVASLAVLFLFLPSLLILCDKIWMRFRGGRVPDWPKKCDESKPVQASWVDHISRVFIEHHAITSTVCVAVLALFAWGAVYIQTDLKPKRFFEDGHQLNVDYRWVAHAIGPQVPIEIVVKFDTQTSKLTMLEQFEMVSNIEREVRAADEIAMTLSATTYVPPLEELATGTQTSDFVVNERLEEGRPRLKDAAVISRDGTEDLWRISCRSRGLHEDEGYDDFLTAVRNRIDIHLIERKDHYKSELVRLRRVGKENREKLEKWYAKKQVDLANEADKLAAATKQYGLTKEDINKTETKLLAALDDPSTGVETVVTGMVPLFFAAQRELFNGLVSSFVVAFVLIAILMIVLLRSTRAGLISMLPNVFPVAVIFGGMGWTGAFVDIGSMMTASVAMGIAVDDTVHFLTWFRRGMHDGMSRREAVSDAYRRCAMAMTQTTAIAGLSLLVFGLSPFQPVSQFGILMFVLLLGALVGDLVFLPALLAGPAGRLFEEKHNDRMIKSDPQPVSV